MDVKQAKVFLTERPEFSSERLADAETAKRYYEGKNDILFDRRRDGETEVLRSADNRIPHTFYPLLVNQKTAYLFTDPPIFSTGDASSDRVIADVLGGSFAKKCQRLCVKASNSGTAWLHYWQGADGAFCYDVLDGTQVFAVCSDDLQRELLYAVRIYRVKRGEGASIVYEIWDKFACYAFAHDENSDIQTGLAEYPAFGNGVGRGNVLYHPFGAPPFILFANNELMSTDLANVKRLIDIYDKTYSGFANDLEDIQEIILTLSGYGGTDIGEFLDDLKKYKVIKLDEGVERPGVDTLSIQIPVEAREKMLELTRSAIFEEGQGIDPRPRDFGNASGVALRFMYSLLELKAGLTETQFREGFDRLVRAIASYYGLKIGSVGQVWTRTAIQNDAELADIAQQSTDILSRETILRRHPWVEDPARELMQLRRETRASDGSPTDADGR